MHDARESYTSRRCFGLFRKACGLLQDVRDGAAATRAFHKVMQDLVSMMRTETPDPSSIAAHLLDIKDPSTGAPHLYHLGPASLCGEGMHLCDIIF